MIYASSTFIQPLKHVRWAKGYVNWAVVTGLYKRDVVLIEVNCKKRKNSKTDHGSFSPLTLPKLSYMLFATTSSPSRDRFCTSMASHGMNVDEELRKDRVDGES